MHTRATLPDWDGWYFRGTFQRPPEGQWLNGNLSQTATMLSLLTPEYQARMTQMNYHEAVNNAPQWMASFCYPEGLMRWWYVWGIRDMEVLVTPNQVQLLAGVADNFVRKVLIGQHHTQLLPQWYGETVGFWDDDTLVAWTANVQGWTMSHSMIEFSNELEVIEIIRRAADGEGLVVEAVFYDPEAFARPLRIVTPWTRTGGIEAPTGATRSSSAASRTASCSDRTDVRRSSRRSTKATSISSAGRGRRTGKSSSSRAGSDPRRSRRTPTDLWELKCN